LFIHQNMPGQYAPFRLAQRFLARRQKPSEFCAGPTKMDLVRLEKLTRLASRAQALRRAPS
jgi:hypothetical protein